MSGPNGGEREVRRGMWVVTKTEWPTLVNLAVISSVGYQQVAKYDPRTRVIASTWKQELVLAECATGEEAQAVVRRLASSLAEGLDLLDLNAGAPGSPVGDEA